MGKFFMSLLCMGAVASAAGYLALGTGPSAPVPYQVHARPAATGEHMVVALADVDNDLDDDEDEVAVSLDSIPAAAREALLALAGSAVITEVEAESENGVTVYEATWLVDGVEREAAVNASGAVVESDDDDEHEGSDEHDDHDDEHEEHEHHVVKGAGI